MSTKETYVLELEGGRIYVGCSSTPDRRISKHLKGGASTWTRLHKAQRVLERIPGNVEKETTLKYMKERGRENVRGYCWTQVHLHPIQPTIDNV